jgi:beta-galactosidase
MRCLEGACLLLLNLAAAAAWPADATLPDRFLFGASTYPELQTPAEWNRMLDYFEKAHFNVVRVSESSWGNLETAPGQYDFGWLRQYLDDVARHHMKAILGTSSYIAPQWLSARHPEILVQLEPGIAVHPMARKAACLTHPIYREAVSRYVAALGRAFKDHPAVIGWQLDNEIEFLVGRVCYNAACERAWRTWLRETYHTPEEFNTRLDLASWGMRVASLDDVPQPRGVLEGGRVGLPALTLANLHFRRDVILRFLIEQAQALRQAGVTQWLTTDWNTVWLALADDPLSRRALDLAGLNFYQPSAENAEFWRSLAWHQDMHRSAHDLGRFLVTETRVGVAGDTVMWDPFPTRDQFRMWMLQPAAFGAMGLLYWSGNRWHGGHWPQWGGVLDWTGQPEPDFAWLIETGDFFRKWGEALLRNPVNAKAAVVTDFDQRAALQVYAHTPSSRSVLPEAFDALHRLGIGVDAIAPATASLPGRLDRYALVVIAAGTALDADALPKALRAYVADGGNVVVTPFTAYQSWDGVFRKDGFGANLASLTGTVARTARRMGTAADPGRSDQHVVWMQGTSPVGIDGYCEYLEVVPDTEVMGRFRSDEPLLDGRPAASRKKIGKGSVIKLAFWPADDSVLRLFAELAPDPASILRPPCPPGVQAVPRSDGSLFVINTSGKTSRIQLTRAVIDRISGKKLEGSVQLNGFAVLWLH